MPGTHDDRDGDLDRLGRDATRLSSSDSLATYGALLLRGAVAAARSDVARALSRGGVRTEVLGFTATAGISL